MSPLCFFCSETAQYNLQVFRILNNVSGDAMAANGANKPVLMAPKVDGDLTQQW